MNLEFSPARWGRLLAHRLTDSAKPLGLALAVVAGLQLVVLLLAAGHNFVLNGGFWGLFVAFAAVFTAATAFKPMHEGRSATDWLLWPASSTEKWAAAAAEVLIVPAVLAAASTAASALLAAVVWLVHGQPSPVWFPWSDQSASRGGGLAVVLSVFFAGSAAFRKNALWKTGLVLVGAGLAFFLVSAAVLKLSGRLQAEGAFGGPEGFGFRMSTDHGGFAGPGADGVKILGDLWFGLVVPAFCLAFSWAKVREKEARDEVQ